MRDFDCPSYFQEGVASCPAGEDAEHKTESFLYYVDLKRPRRQDHGPLQDPHSTDPERNIMELRHGKLYAYEILDWFHHQGRFESTVSDPKDGRESLRLLIVLLDITRPKYDLLLPLPMSEAVFQEASSTMAIPKSFLTIISRRSGGWRFEPAKDGRHGFVMQNNYSSHVHFSLGSAYDPTSATTSAMLLGVRRPNLDHILSTLQTDMADIPIQLLLPVVMIDHTVDMLRDYLAVRHKTIYDMEGETGLTSFDKKEAMNPDQSARNAVNLHEVTKSLTACQAELGYVLHTANIAAGLLVLLRQLIEPMQCFPPDLPRHSYARLQFESKIDYLESYVAATKSRQGYLLSRMQGQVQTVYSIIAQRDNAANQQAAEASLQLAELSRRDNAVMVSIAEDSRLVAILTSQDSAAMRVIAAVTILFLPATFTATLFSTSFFNFQQDGSVVSRWLWIYWLVTAVLTLAIHAAWYVLSKRKERRVTSRFGHVTSREAKLERAGAVESADPERTDESRGLSPAVTRDTSFALLKL